MPVDPKSLRWLVCGTDDAPKGMPVPMSDALRTAVAAALPSPVTPAVPPVPAVPQVPVWPKRTRYIAPADPNSRGDGWARRDVQQGVSLANALIDGYEQNIVIERCGPSVVENVVSCNSRPADVWADTFRGQGIFADACPSLAVKGYAAVSAGWQAGMPLRTRNQYRHGGYFSWGLANLVIEDPIFWGCAAMGAQFRQWKGTVIIRRPVCIDCGCGLLPVAGNVTIESPTVYGGHHWAVKGDDGNWAWTGNMALSSYTAVKLSDAWIVGTPGQDKSPDGSKAYSLGAVLGSKNYGPADRLIKSGDLPPAARPKGASWDVSGDNRIFGWPGPAFAGDAPCQAAGWKVGGNPVDPAKLPLAKWLADLTQSDRPVADVAAEMRDTIRGAAA